MPWPIVTPTRMNDQNGDDGYVRRRELRALEDLITERYALRMRMLDGIIWAILIAVAMATLKLIVK